jgi:hypothetical protein
MIRAPSTGERCNKPCQPFHVRATANGEARKWDQVDQIARLSPLDLSLSISHLALFYLPSFLFGLFFFLLFKLLRGWRSFDATLWPKESTPPKTTYNLSRTRTKPNKSCDESIMHPSRRQKYQTDFAIISLPLVTDSVFSCLDFSRDYQDAEQLKIPCAVSLSFFLSLLGEWSRFITNPIFRKKIKSPANMIRID